MTPDDFKGLLDEALAEVRRDLKEVKVTQGKHSEVLQALQASVITIEKEIKAYGDMYKINNSNDNKLEQRVEVLEDKAGVIPPQEHTLADVS